MDGLKICLQLLGCLLFGVRMFFKGTMGKRLQNINVENSEENRRAYRQLLFTSGKELSEHISGVILYHETLYQKAHDGQTFVNLLRSNGIIAGIKVDTGTVPLAGSDGECTTQGAFNLLPLCVWEFELLKHCFNYCVLFFQDQTKSCQILSRDSHLTRPRPFSRQYFCFGFITFRVVVYITQGTN